MMPTPFQPALDRLAAKTPVGSVFRSAEWAEMPLALREQAFQTAGLERAQTVARMQGLIKKALTPTAGAAQGGEVFMDKSRFVALMRQHLGAVPGDSGRLTDITSNRRLALIYNVQVEDAYSHGRWKVGQDPTILDEYPAQELVRVESRDTHRDWEARWDDKGGARPQGRMVALKNDPIWSAISRFGRPWPPFDFGSGIGVQDVDREEAEALGLIQPNETVPPDEQDFNAKLEASAPTPEVQRALKETFGEQIEIEGGKARWKQPPDPAANDAAVAGLKRTLPPVRAALEKDLKQELKGSMWADHVVEEWSVQATAAAVGQKPLFHEAVDGEAQAQRLATLLRARLPAGAEVRTQGEQLFVYRPDAVRTLLPDPQAPIWDQLKDLGHDGKLLGYGVDRFEGESVKVEIIGPDGTANGVGFRAPPEKARLFGSSRARDWSLTTGQDYSYRILSGK